MRSICLLENLVSYTKTSQAKQENKLNKDQQIGRILGASHHQSQKVNGNLSSNFNFIEEHA
jgi:hypothetical protein